MPVITSSPTAKTISEAYEIRFAAEAIDAAGTDRILTKQEAREMQPAALRNSALNYFERKGTESAKVGVVIGGVTLHVARQVDKAAVTQPGSLTDRRLSAADAQKLPADVRAAYDYLKSLP